MTGLWQAVAAGLLASSLLFAAVAEGRRDRDRSDTGPVISVAELPVQARETLALIRRGGPFNFDRDGVVFGNRERLLPPKPRGYYHEYTVPTPGSRTRGARRIVCGGDVSTLAECYYSHDHYQSFTRIGR
jgi:ribonuclease T1